MMIEIHGDNMPDVEPFDFSATRAPLFPGWPAAVPKRSAKQRINPLVKVYGAGPEGATCGGCSHLVRRQHHTATYFKCRLYGESNGAGTDWRKKWQACGRYAEDTEGHHDR